VVFLRFARKSARRALHECRRCGRFATGLQDLAPDASFTYQDFLASGAEVSYLQSDQELFALRVTEVPPKGGKPEWSSLSN